MGPRYLKWVKATTAVSRGQPLLWDRFPDTLWPWAGEGRPLALEVEETERRMGPRLPLAAILGRRAP